MIDKGYIDETERGYEFYEYPKKTPIIKPMGEVREFIDDETGEVFKYSYNQLISIVGEKRAADLWESDNNVSE